MNERFYNETIILKLPNDKQWREAERRVEEAMEELKGRTLRKIIHSVQGE